MDVVEASDTDFGGFLSLAAEVEDWFGPMVGEPGFHAIVERKIQEHKAFVVRAEDRLLGGLMIGGAGPDYHLSWLVVSAAARGEGVGKALLGHVLERFRRPCRVDVITFGRDHPGAMSSG
ncbi:MAG TPA: GNAT family N-acetyltransferase, partial [Mycobacteriales bacterium]|nr:GNAT family N-acetyltransferase [Mycobacteriales bacterium]